jgi:enamine deaminase RidA (YjgF/YER057c/UK114 family)
MNEIRKSHSRLDVFEVRLGDHREYSISVDTGGDLSLHTVLADGLRSLNAVPLNRFVLGGCQHYPAYVKEWGTPVSPLTWIQGDACKSGEMSSTQVTAVSGLSVTPIEFGGRVVGTCYEDDYARYVRLGGLLPSDPSASREVQARSLFDNIVEILAGQGMGFTHTFRTWLYLDNLLDWYDPFNAIRTDFFEEQGIFDAMVPASTGIGAANPAGTAIIADLLAVRPKCEAVNISTVESPLQCSAMNYRSSFSRAVEVELPTHRTLYISGTASIDGEGRSVYLGDARRQIEYTVAVVDEILCSRGMDWGDISRGIAYFKNRDDVALFKTCCMEKGIERFPLSISHADVCRDDLLFELEVDAITLGPFQR